MNSKCLCERAILITSNKYQQNPKFYQHDFNITIIRVIFDFGKSVTGYANKQNDEKAVHLPAKSEIPKQRRLSAGPVTSHT